VPRFGFRFQAVTELHAVVVMFLAGLIVATFFALRLSAVPPAAHRAYAMLLAATVLQAAVGYSQYFAGLPADLIEIHIVGAGILVITAVRFSLALGPCTTQPRPSASTSPAR
jgi:cytochrome c oxidase assembly protein subunit 15